MMHKRAIRALIALAVTGVVLSAAASALQAEEAGGPGHFPFEELGLFAGEQVNVDVNLAGAMIRLAAAMLDPEEPELADLIKSIERIRAQVVEDDLASPSTVRGRMAEAVSWLEQRGWNRSFKMAEDDEEVHVFVRESENALVGIAILAFEDGSATAVNIVGTIDPEKFGRFMAREDFSEVTGFLEN